MNKYEKQKNIWPLTIVRMRYGGKYVAFNTEADCEVVLNVQIDEEAMYDTKSYIEDRYIGRYIGRYGIGDTIEEALDNLISNQNNVR